MGYMCVFPYIYRKILKMLPKVAKLCEKMGSMYEHFCFDLPFPYDLFFALPVRST